jgi:hypothetical protein
MKWRKVANQLGGIAAGLGAGAATAYEGNRRFVHKAEYIVDIPDITAAGNYKQIVKNGVVKLLLSDGTYEDAGWANFNVSVEKLAAGPAGRRVLVTVQLDKTNKQIHKGFHLAWFMVRTKENPQKRFEDLQRLAEEQPNRSSVQKALSVILPV